MYPHHASPFSSTSFTKARVIAPIQIVPTSDSIISIITSALMRLCIHKKCYPSISFAALRFCVYLYALASFINSKQTNEINRRTAVINRD